VAEMTVYCVKNGSGRRRYFTVDDGKVQEHIGYQEAFGPRLTELYPTLTFEHRGKALPAHRYSLCWGAIERYEPLSAKALAILRESRERKKAEREEAVFQRDNPLLAWAEQGGGVGQVSFPRETGCPGKQFFQAAQRVYRSGC
jgi:hypothetical protein